MLSLQHKETYEGTDPTEIIDSEIYYNLNGKYTIMQINDAKLFVNQRSKLNFNKNSIIIRIVDNNGNHII